MSGIQIVLTCFAIAPGFYFFLNECVLACVWRLIE